MPRCAALRCTALFQDVGLGCIALCFVLPCVAAPCRAALDCSAARYIVVQRNAIQCDAIQSSAVQRSSRQHVAVQRNTVHFAPHIWVAQSPHQLPLVSPQEAATLLALSIVTYHSVLSGNGLMTCMRPTQSAGAGCKRHSCARGSSRQVAPWRLQCSSRRPPTVARPRS